MDTYGFMSNNKELPTATGGAEAARKALEMIGQMRPRLKMADGWFKTIRRTHLYYMRIKKDFRRNVKALSAQGDFNALSALQKQLSLREGGSGGGAEEFKLIERTLKDFGALEDEDLEMTDAHAEEFDDNRTGGDRMTDTGSPDSGNVKQQGWATINTVASGHRASDAGISSAPGVNGYVQHQHQKSGFSTPGLSTGLSTSPTGQSLSASENTGYAGHVPLGQGGTMGFASVEDARNASHNLQRQINAQRAQGLAEPPAMNWTPEMELQWLDSLETRFSGDDIAAFVEGNEWQDWAGVAAAQQQPGWLSTVWT